MRDDGKLGFEEKLQTSECATVSVVFCPHRRSVLATGLRRAVRSMVTLRLQW